jgi:hypothetical protein
MHTAPLDLDIVKIHLYIDSVKIKIWNRINWGWREAFLQAASVFRLKSSERIWIAHASGGDSSTYSLGPVALEGT